MKVSLIVGGPEPADGGRLNIIRFIDFLYDALSHSPFLICSVHSGSIQGPVKSMFGQSERVGYKQDIVSLFSSFLKKCYSKWPIVCCPPSC